MGAKKNEKGKGKVMENRRKQKRDEDDYEDDEAEDGEMEMEENWRSFMMAISIFHIFLSFVSYLFHHCLLILI